MHLKTLQEYKRYHTVCVDSFMTTRPASLSARDLLVSGLFEASNVMLAGSLAKVYKHLLVMCSTYASQPCGVALASGTREVEYVVGTVNTRRHLASR